jgi:hypothetical protein
MSLFGEGIIGGLTLGAAAAVFAAGAGATATPPPVSSVFVGILSTVFVLEP